MYLICFVSINLDEHKLGETMRKILIVTLLAGGLRWAGASPVFGTSATFSGSRSEPVELITGGKYATDGKTLTVSWNITVNGSDPTLLDYSYTFTGYNPPGISHFILSLSPGCSDDPRCIMAYDADLE